MGSFGLSCARQRQADRRSETPSRRPRHGSGGGCVRSNRAIVAQPQRKSALWARENRPRSCGAFLRTKKQRGDAAVHTAAQLFVGELGEPAFHEVQPRPIGRREVHVKPRPLREPISNHGRLVRSVESMIRCTPRWRGTAASTASRNCRNSVERYRFRPPTPKSNWTTRSTTSGDGVSHRLTSGVSANAANNAVLRGSQMTGDFTRF